MPGHLLGVLEPSIVFQVDRDAGRPPGVTSDWSEKTRRLGPLPNRGPGVVSINLRARPVTAVPSELTLLKRGCPLWRPAATMYSSNICSSR
jgi:hypothetical protein